MSLFWLRVAVLLYGVAALAVLPVALFDRPRWRLIAIPAAFTALLFHLVSFVETLNAAHHRLPVDTHETLSLLGLICALAFLIVYWRYRAVSLGIFLLPVCFLLGVVPAFRAGEQSALFPQAQAQLHAVWILFHVTLLLAAYAALLISLIASVLYLIQERSLKSRRPRRSRRSKIVPRGTIWLPPLETTDQIALRSLLFGLPLMTAGLLIGAFIAQQTRGFSYFMDPKVLLSFVLWLAYVGMIYIRRHSGLRGRRAAYLSGFVFLVALAVWAANQLSAVHRFPAP